MTEEDKAVRKRAFEEGYSTVRFIAVTLINYAWG